MYNNYTLNQNQGWGAAGYVMSGSQGGQPAVQTQQFVQNSGTLRGTGMPSQMTLQGQLQQQYLQQQQAAPSFSAFYNQLEMQQQQQAYLQQQQLYLQQQQLALQDQWSQMGQQQLAVRPQQHPPLPVDPHPDVIEDQKLKIQRQQEQLRQLWNSNKQDEGNAAAAAAQQQLPPAQDPTSSALTFSAAEIESTVNKILPFINDIFSKVGVPGKDQIPGLGELSQQLTKQLTNGSISSAKSSSTTIPSKESNQSQKQQQQVPTSTTQTQKQPQQTSSWQALKASQEKAKLLNQNAIQQQQQTPSSVKSPDLEIIEVEPSTVDKPTTVADNSNKNEVGVVVVASASSVPTFKEIEKQTEQVTEELPPTTSSSVENKNIDVNGSSAITTTASTLLTTSTTTVISTENANKANDNNKEPQQSSKTSIPPSSVNSIIITTTTNAVSDTNVNGSKEESSPSSSVVPHTSTAQTNQTYDAKALAAFDEKFKNWEKQFEDWKASNAKHPDRTAYTKYLDQWTRWRMKLQQQRKFIIDKINAAKGEPPNRHQEQIMANMNNDPVVMANSNFLSNNSSFNKPTNNIGPISAGPRMSLLTTPTVGLSSTSVPFARYNESQQAVRIININTIGGPSIGANNNFGARGTMNQQQRLPRPSFQDKVNPFVTPSSGFGLGSSGPGFGGPRMDGGYGLNSFSGSLMGMRGMNDAPVRIPRVNMFDGGPVPRRPPGGGGFMSGGFKNYDDEVGDDTKYVDRFANEDRESPPPAKQRNNHHMNPFDNFDRNPFDIDGDDARFENPWMSGNQGRGSNPFEMMDFIQSKQKLQARNSFDTADNFRNDARRSQRDGFASLQQQQQSRGKPDLDAVEEDNLGNLFQRGRPSRSQAPVSGRDDYFEQPITDFGHASSSNDVPDDMGDRNKSRDAARQGKENIPYGAFVAEDAGDGHAVTIDYGHGSSDIPPHPNYYYDEHKKLEERSSDRGGLNEFDGEDDDYRIRPKPYREDNLEGPGDDYRGQMPPHHPSGRKPYYGAGDRERPGSPDRPDGPGSREPPYYGAGERGHSSPCGPDSMPRPRMSFGGLGRPSFPSVEADPDAFRGGVRGGPSRRVAPPYKGALSAIEDEPDIVIISSESKGVKLAPPRNDWLNRRDLSRDRSPPGRRERERSPLGRDRGRSPGWRDRERSPYRRGRERSLDLRERERERDRDRERDRMRRERDRERERDWKYSRGGRNNTPPRRSRIDSDPFESRRGVRNTSRSKSPVLTNPPPPASSLSSSGGSGDSRLAQKQRAPPVLIEEILSVTGKKRRPSQIAIIFRGLPGSGKSHLAKLIKDKEMELGGSAPRILSLDDYFMTDEVERVVKDPVTGKDVKEIVMQYEYEPLAESKYRQDLIKAFKKTVDNGYFPFIIVDSVNDRIRYFEDMAHYAALKRFQVYIAEVEEAVDVCIKRNIHDRTRMDITTLHKNWEAIPPHFLRLDMRALLQDEVQDDVEMEDVDDFEARAGFKNGTTKVVTVDLAEGDEDDEVLAYEHAPSKWETTDQSEERLNKLDGLRITKRRLVFGEAVDQVTSVEAWLKCNLPENYSARVVHENGKKRVRWADIEERREQQKIKNLGFVVGQTDWSRMNDPTFGAGALTRTTFI